MKRVAQGEPKDIGCRQAFSRRRPASAFAFSGPTILSDGTPLQAQGGAAATFPGGLAGRNPSIDFHGKTMQVAPEAFDDRPSGEFLTGRNENACLGQATERSQRL